MKICLDKSVQYNAPRPRNKKPIPGILLNSIIIKIIPKISQISTADMSIINQFLQYIIYTILVKHNLCKNS